MIITSKFKMDLKAKGAIALVDAVQDDVFCRALCLELYDGGTAWEIPEDAAVLVTYQKEDGTGGEYDTLPDGTSGWSAESNRLTVMLAPQVMTAAGAVRLAITVMTETARISTFDTVILVHRKPGFEGVSENYRYSVGYLPQPTGFVESGAVLMIDSIANGKVTGVAGAPIDSQLTLPGVPAEARAVGKIIGKLADLKTECKDDLVSAINEAARAGGTLVCIGPEEPVDGSVYWLDTSDSVQEGAVTYTVTTAFNNVSIDNAAGSINEGESYTAALSPEEGFTLTRAMVTMGGGDITAAVYSGGNIYIASVTGDIVITAEAEEVQETAMYSITSNLVNITSDNTALSVPEGAAYSARLTAAGGYTLVGAVISVIMAGESITDTAYSDGVITIEAVTGDVVITANAETGTGEAVELSQTVGSHTVYSDAGTTQLSQQGYGGILSTEVFDKDTKVKITITMKTTIYSGGFTASSYTGAEYHWGEAVPKNGDSYFTAGKTYTHAYTVRAGCRLALSGQLGGAESYRAIK